MEHIPHQRKGQVRNTRVLAFDDVMAENGRLDVLYRAEVSLLRAFRRSHLDLLEFCLMLTNGVDLLTVSDCLNIAQYKGD